MFRVYGWCLTCAPLCFLGAPLCSYPSTKVPLPWRNSALTKALCLLSEQGQLLGILFFCFLIIGNVCSGIYIKCMWWVSEKSLYQRKFKIGMRFYPSPFIFSPGMPINTGGLRVKGKNAPFITLHRSSSFLPFISYNCLVICLIRNFAGCEKYRH